MGILVEPIQTGFYGKYREAGSEPFEIADEKAFSAVWMKRVGVAAEHDSKPKKVKQE